MKKFVFCLVLAAMSAGSGVFAQMFSVGGGALLVPSFQTTKPKGGGDEQKYSGFGGGANIFFDATYAEANVSVLFGSLKSEDADDPFITTDLVLGIVGKYPISLGEKLAVFPFAGIDYRINLGATMDGKELEDTGDMFNALSVLFGIGLDYSITSALYFRGEVGFGLTFNSKAEDDDKDSIDSNFKGKVPIKLAVGYRF